MTETLPPKLWRVYVACAAVETSTLPYLETLKRKLDELIETGNSPVVTVNHDYGKPVATLVSTEICDDELYAVLDVRDEQMRTMMDDPHAGHFRLSYAYSEDPGGWRIAGVSLVAASIE